MSDPTAVLQHANPHAPTSIGGTSLTYDNNGNVTAHGSQGYAWDYRNRLTEAGTGSATSTYAYDHTHERVKKVFDSTTTYYPNDLYSVAGATSTKNIVANGELIAVIESTGSATSTHFIHNDHLSSVNAITDEEGEVIQSIDYYPFGSKRISTGIDVSQREFLGQIEDPETSLNYLNARHLQGSRGQFTSQDPMSWVLPQQLLLDPQQQNSYSYARNNPINGSDPTGLLTVVVPGTFNDSQKANPEVWSDKGKASQFLSNVSKTFGEKAQVFKWSGQNNTWARKEAAGRLAEMINNYSFPEGERLNIIGYSHGGNVATLATQQVLKHQVDNLVTLGTPNRTVYQPKGTITNHINVYSRFDPVQVAGEVGDPLTVNGVDRRRFEGATNIGAGLRAGINPWTAHTNLLRNESVWSLVDAKINP